MPSSVEGTDSQDKNSILKTASDNIASWFSYFSQNIAIARDLTRFVYVEQWDEADREERDARQKPTLTFNKLNPIVRAIVGEQRDNTPALEVRATSGDVSESEVDLRANLIRQICYDSKAQVAYQTAFGTALVTGWGAIRLYTDYENEDSFNQVIRIKPILDPTVVFFDPSATLPDKSDGDFVGIYETLSQAEFKNRYPDAETTFAFDDNDIGSFQWGDEESVTICEYYAKEYTTKNLVYLSNGETMDEKKLKDYLKEFKLINPGVTPPEVKKERDSVDITIKHYKLMKDCVLEETEYPGKYFPIIFVDGNSLISNTFGFSRKYSVVVIQNCNIYC